MCILECMNEFKDISSASWSPVVIRKCRRKRCQETRNIIRNVAVWISGHIEPSVYDGTKRPILEWKYARQYTLISEFNRIIHEDTLKEEEKEELLEVPSLQTVRAFLRHFVTICQVKPEIVVCGISLMRRFLATTGWKLRATTWRILLITCIRVAQKVEAHPSLLSTDLSHVYPLFKPNEFVEIENVILKILNYKVLITNEVFSHQYSILSGDRESAEK
mmetsp:Transcript_8711/g.9436  ORF Transcript_8711/g.9436 Transcript_8711/m.9436 type:complete len:219 (+) Transcript_8711:341-997(+)